ncbi:hypothetical protein KA107_00140 [Candidatus Pacearchaeota archaeon]|nr:hypothetical protein [Candidatus Pacearchaeota archaeon]
MRKTTLHTCASEEEFLALKGDGTESVKLTTEYDNPSANLNGWYVFVRDEGKNNFLKQSATLPLVDLLTCETKYFQFDEKAGLLPNTFHRTYWPVGPSQESYSSLVGRLREAGVWREVREVRTWEFAKEKQE